MYIIANIFFILGYIEYTWEFSRFVQKVQLLLLIFLQDEREMIIYE